MRIDRRNLLKTVGGGAAGVTATKQGLATQSGAFFEVDIEIDSGTVEPGDEYEVTWTITNTGTQTAEQEVEFGWIDPDGNIPEPPSELEFELEPGESWSETADVEFTPGEDFNFGVWEGYITSEDDSDSDFVEFQEPGEAFFEVDVEVDPGTVEPGEDQTGEQEGEWGWINPDGDPDPITDWEFELDPGDQEVVPQTNEFTPGEDFNFGVWEAHIASEDDSDSDFVEFQESESYFEVTITSTNAPVTEGDILQVEAEVTNTGAHEVTFIDLFIDDPDGDFEDWEEVDLDNGETTDVTLEYITQDGDAPSVDVFVIPLADGAGDETTVSVEPGGSAAFELSNFSQPEELPMDEELTGDVDVTNTGNASGTADVAYVTAAGDHGDDWFIYGVPVNEVTLNSGETDSLSGNMSSFEDLNDEFEWTDFSPGDEILTGFRAYDNFPPNDSTREKEVAEPKPPSVDSLRGKKVAESRPPSDDSIREKGVAELNDSLDADDSNLITEVLEPITIKEAEEFPELELTAEDDKTVPGGEATVEFTLSNTGGVTAENLGVSLGGWPVYNSDWDFTEVWGTPVTDPAQIIEDPDAGEFVVSDAFWDVPDLDPGESQTLVVTFESPEDAEPDEYAVIAEEMDSPAAEATAIIEVSELTTTIEFEEEGDGKIFPGFLSQHGHAAYSGFSVTSTDDIPDWWLLSGDLAESLEELSSWEEEREQMIVYSHADAGGDPGGGGTLIPVVGRAAEQRTGVLSFSGTITPEETEVYRLRLWLRHLLVLQARQWDITSVSSGGSLCGATLELMLVDTEEDEIVEHSSDRIDALSYPEDYTPSDYNMMVQQLGMDGAEFVAESVIEEALDNILDTAITGAKIKTFGAFGIIWGATTNFLFDTHVFNAIDEHRFVRLDTELEAGKEYEWHLSYVTDTRADVTTPLGFDSRRSLVAVNADVDDIEIVPLSNTNSSRMNTDTSSTPPQTEFTEVTTGRVHDGIAQFAWENVDDSPTTTEYKYQLVGTYKGEIIYEDESEWSTTTDISFTDLPAGNYSFEVTGRYDETLVEPVSTRATFSVSGTVTVNVADNEFIVSDDETTIETEVTIAAEERTVFDARVGLRGDAEYTEQATIEGSDAEDLPYDLGDMESGDTQTVSLSVSLADIPAGSTGTIFPEAFTSHDATDSESIAIEIESQSPFFETELVAVDPSAPTGGTLGATVAVKNRGEAEGSKNVWLTIDDEIVDETEGLTLSGDEETEVTFEYDVGDEELPSFTPVVSSPDDVDTAVVRVDELTPVVGDTLPRDLNNDGLYEDIDGDGEFTILDVQALFENLDSEAVQDNSPAFDFLGDNRVTIFDVQALFNQLQEWDGPD